jgi:hypothetical protein
MLFEAYGDASSQKAGRVNEMREGHHEITVQRS